MKGRHIPTFQCAIFVAALALAAFAGAFIATVDAQAHAPSGVSLNYDASTGTLSVSIDHTVTNPSVHYIKSVEIKKNSEAVSLNNYTSQPSMTSFIYTYDVEAAPGDVLEATATCSLAGSKTGQIAVQAKPLPTIAIEVPESGTTIYNSQTTVSGTATGDLASGKVELSVNGGPWLEAIGVESWGLQITLVEGSNNVTARVTDSDGMTAEATINIISEAPGTPPPPERGEVDSPGFGAAALLLAILAFSIVAKAFTKR